MAPWDLLQQPAIWLDWADTSEAAEMWAEIEREKRNRPFS